MSTRTSSSQHQADRGPSTEESEIADRQAEELHQSGEDAEVAEHYQEMAERGVDQKGEGKIE